jgi:hypothetical protein
VASGLPNGERVAFQNGSFVLLLSDSSWRGFTAESVIILGNIYENSELLG